MSTLTSRTGVSIRQVSVHYLEKKARLHHVRPEGSTAGYYGTCMRLFEGSRMFDGSTGSVAGYYGTCMSACARACVCARTNACKRMQTVAIRAAED